MSETKYYDGTDGGDITLAGVNFEILAADLARSLALKPCNCSETYDKRTQKRVTQRCDAHRTLDRYYAFPLVKRPEINDA